MFLSGASSDRTERCRSLWTSLSATRTSTANGFVRLSSCSKQRVGRSGGTAASSLASRGCPELEAEIAKARAMVVVWSPTSVKSQWVRHEAGRGLEQHALVPVMFDVKAPPAEFAHLQAIDLSRWDGNKQITEIEALQRRLASLAPPSRIDTVRPGYDPLFLGSKRPVKLPGVTGPVAGAALSALHGGHESCSPHRPLCRLQLRRRACWPRFHGPGEIPGRPIRCFPSRCR